EGQRRGEARRFDAVEIDEAWHAMRRRPLDDEVAGRLAGGDDLRPYAGIAWLQRAVPQRGPVAADGGIEGIAAPDIDGVVDRVDPFDVGAEARLAGEVEGEVDAEPGLLRHRVDQMRERRLAGQGEIDAAAEIVARDARRRYPGDAAGERRRIEPGAIDQHAAGEPHRLGAADFQLEPVGGGPAALDRRPADDHRASSLGVALIGEHQRMAVDDAGRGRDEAADRGEIRLKTAQRVGAEEFKIADAVRRRPLANAVEQRELALLAGDDELAEPLVLDAALGAIGIEHLAAGDAGARLEAAPRVVDAGMDDLAVARGGLEADAVFALEHHDLDAGA